MHDVFVCKSWYQPVGHTRQSLLLWESLSCQPTGQRAQSLAISPVVIEPPRMAFQPALQLSQYDIPFWFCHLRWPHVLHEIFPALSWYQPVGQSSHAVSASAPVLSRNVPAGHGVIEVPPVQ